MKHHRATGRTSRIVLAAFITLSAAAVPAIGPDHAAAATNRPIPVIYDSDMDFDDASTLAYLCEEHKLGRIDLRAVTVSNNGFGIPGRALQHARTILRQCGLPQVPVADGSTGAGVHPAPPELVSTIETVLTGALGDGGAVTPPSSAPAADLIVRAARASSRRVTVIATGPLTNLATALGTSRVPEHIERIQVMGGAFHVPGNLYGSALPGFDNSQEFNIWLDPLAAQAVLDRARPGTVRIVPLDATRFVPITQTFVSRLAADQDAPGARLAYAIVSQPDLAALIDLGIMYWWDAIAAVSLVHSELITAWQDLRIAVVPDGEQSGRTIITIDGRRVSAAIEADGPTFENTFLNALNGRR